MSENQTSGEVPTMVEMLANIPARPKRERLWKTLHDKMPGHISVANDRANFSGCRYVKFFSGMMPVGLEEEDELRFHEELTKDLGKDEALEKLEAMSDVEYANAYFSTRANLLVLEKDVQDIFTQLTITTQLDEDDLEEMTEFQRRVNVEMEKWHQERYDRQQDSAKEMQEIRRLAKVGKLTEDHNVAGQLREANEKIKSLTRQLNDLEASDE